MGAATDRRPAEHARSPAAASDAERARRRGRHRRARRFRRSHRRRGRPAVDSRGCLSAARWFCSLRRSQRPQRSPTPSRETPTHRPQHPHRPHPPRRHPNSAQQNRTPPNSSCAKYSTCRHAGQQGQGGVRINGAAERTLMLRSLNSAVAVQNALMPAAPADVAEAARNVRRRAPATDDGGNRYHRHPERLIASTAPLTTRRMRSLMCAGCLTNGCR